MAEDKKTTTTTEFQIAAPYLEQNADGDYIIPSDALVFGNVQILSGPVNLSITQTPNAQFVPVPQAGGALAINDNKVETVITATFVFPEEFFHRTETFLYRNYPVHVDLAALLALFDYTFVFPIYHSKLAELLGEKDFFWQSIGSVRLDWLGNAKGIQVSVVLLKTHLQEMSNLPITFKEKKKREITNAAYAGRAVKEEIVLYVPRFYHSNFLYNEISNLKGEYIVTSNEESLIFSVDKNVVATRLLRLASNDLNKLTAQYFLNSLAGGENTDLQKVEILKASIQSIIEEVQEEENQAIEIELTPDNVEDKTNALVSLSWGYENYLIRHSNLLMPNTNYYQHMGRSPYRMGMRFITRNHEVVSGFQRLAEKGNKIQKQLGMPLLPLNINNLPVKILRDKPWYIQNILINSVDEYPGTFEIEINLITFGDLLSFEKIYKIPALQNLKFPKIIHKLSLLDQFKDEIDATELGMKIDEKLGNVISKYVTMPLLPQLGDTAKKLAKTSARILVTTAYELAYAQAVWSFLPQIFRDLTTNDIENRSQRNWFTKFLEGLAFAISSMFDSWQLPSELAATSSQIKDEKAKKLLKIIREYFENGYLYALRTLENSKILSGLALSSTLTSDSGATPTPQPAEKQVLKPSSRETKEYENAKENVQKFAIEVLNKLYPGRIGVNYLGNQLYINVVDSLYRTPSPKKPEFDLEEFKAWISILKILGAWAVPDNTNLPSVQLILSGGITQKIESTTYFSEMEGNTALQEIADEIEKNLPTIEQIQTCPEDEEAWKTFLNLVKNIKSDNKLLRATYFVTELYILGGEGVDIVEAAMKFITHLWDLNKQLENYYNMRGISRAIQIIKNYERKYLKTQAQETQMISVTPAATTSQTFDMDKILRLVVQNAKLNEPSPELMQTINFVESIMDNYEWDLKGIESITEEDAQKALELSEIKNITQRQAATLSNVQFVSNFLQNFTGTITIGAVNYRIVADPKTYTVFWESQPFILREVTAPTFIRAWEKLAEIIKNQGEHSIHELLGHGRTITFTLTQYAGGIIGIAQQGHEVYIDTNSQSVFTVKNIKELNARYIAQTNLGEYWEKYQEKIEKKAREFFVDIVYALVTKHTALSAQKFLAYAPGIYNELRYAIEDIEDNYITMVTLYSAIRNYLGLFAMENPDLLEKLEKAGLTMKIRLLPKVAPHEIYNFGYADTINLVLKGIKTHLDSFFKFLEEYGPGDEIWSSNNFASLIDAKAELSETTKALLNSVKDFMKRDKPDDAIANIQPTQIFSNNASLNLDDNTTIQTLSEITSDKVFNTKEKDDPTALSSFIEIQSYKFESLATILDNLKAREKFAKRADKYGISSDVLKWNRNYINSQISNIINSVSPLAKLTPNAAVVFYEIPKILPLELATTAQLQIIQIATDLVYLSIMSVEITKERYNPVDVAIVRMSNYTGVFGESFVPMILSSDFKDNLLTLLLQPGTDIGIKLGYESYFHKLPMVFQGFIRDVRVGPVIEIVAESYGAILARPLFEKKETLTKILAGDPRTFILKALMKTRSEKFGVASNFLERQLRNRTLRQFSDIVELANDDLTVFKTFRYSPASANLYFPQDYWPKFRRTSQGKFWQNFEQYFINYFVLPGYSAWDVVMDAVKMTPGFIQSVVDAGPAKASVFFGKPTYPMFTHLYEPSILSEALSNFTIDSMLSTIENAITIVDEILAQIINNSPKNLTVQSMEIPLIAKQIVLQYLNTSPVTETLKLLQKYGFITIENNKPKINEEFITEELIGSLDESLKLFENLRGLDKEANETISKIQQAKDLLSKFKERVLTPYIDIITTINDAYEILKQLALAEKASQIKSIIDNTLQPTNGAVTKVAQVANAMLRYQKAFASIEPIITPLNEASDLLSGLVNYIFRFELIQLDKFTKLYNIKAAMLSGIKRGSRPYAPEEFGTLPGTKPFANYFVYSSREMLHNTITLSEEKVQNQIVLYAPPWYNVKIPLVKFALAAVNWLATLGSGTTKQPDGHRYTTTIIQFDEDIPPDFLRPKVVYNHYANVPQTRILIGVSELKIALEEMYAGFVGVLGEPSMKPFDYVYIDDITKDIKGLGLVKRVSHIFGPDRGFITTFEIIPHIEVRDLHDSALARVGAFVAEQITSAILVTTTITAGPAGQWWMGALWAAKGAFGSLLAKGIHTVLSPNSYKIINDESYGVAYISFDKIYNPLNIFPLLKHNLPWVQGIEGSVLDKISPVLLSKEKMAEFFSDVWSGMKALVEIPIEYIKVWVDIYTDQKRWNAAIKEALKTYVEQ